ncbi:ArpU family phage packaging/lysis transcriptional regulator [Bacillus pseudomycoides]|uniref:ArpU family phage packaging/lysis transcriptional regulator n=1 Tax=Bacillus pseudomycoides TaxID=64104 RepID=UPI002B4A2943|nr:ArpU family phage packaging/lysis transcriptional regulator [Bacillus pseudomycoides]MEB3057511.1 ArpU family phage packaging/lysis transcriptional regulator [Bacillus pseudomycoides]
MLDIELSELNREETKKNVLKALAKYRLYVSSISEKDRKSIEDGCVVAEKKLERYIYIMELEEAVENSLNTIEKRIIREGYIKSTEHSWVKMSQGLSLSKTPYYNKRNKAFYRLAYALGIEVEG